MSSAIKCGLTPIVCVGESLRQREAGGLWIQWEAIRRMSHR